MLWGKGVEGGDGVSTCCGVKEWGEVLALVHVVGEMLGLVHAVG